VSSLTAATGRPILRRGWFRPLRPSLGNHAEEAGRPPFTAYELDALKMRAGVVCSIYSWFGAEVRRRFSPSTRVLIMSPPQDRRMPSLRSSHLSDAPPFVVRLSAMHYAYSLMLLAVTVLAMCLLLPAI